MNKFPDDNVVPLPLTEQDKADLESLAAEPAAENPQPFYPILKVWLELLKAAQGLATQKVEIHWASRICSMYPYLSFADMNDFRDRYYQKVGELAQILRDTVDSDDECLNVTDVDEDRELNGKHYRHLIDEWQVQFVKWEMDWDCMHTDAELELAAMSEVHKLFFSDKGLIEHLQNIQLQYTEADAAALQERIETIKAG